jgi:hypothetical protein
MMCAMTYLVELKRVQQVVQLAVLGRLVDLDEMLLEPMEGEFSLVIDVDLQRLQKQKEKG